MDYDVAKRSEQDWRAIACAVEAARNTVESSIENLHIGARNEAQDIFAAITSLSAIASEQLRIAEDNTHEAAKGMREAAHV